MPATPNKRSNIVLYVSKSDINSHRIKMVAAEKSVSTHIIEVEPSHYPEELLKINTTVTLPALIDRDLHLNEASIITEYLDERFPHPPLLPVYPITRAKTRLMMLRIEREWYSLAKIIFSNTSQQEIKNAKKLLSESIINFSPVFSSLPFFLSEEFSLLDCCVAPLLWQLPKLNITIPAEITALHQYMDRIFTRPSFQESLNSHEHEYENI